MEILLISITALVICSVYLLSWHPFHPCYVYICTWGIVTILWGLDSVFKIINFTQVSLESWFIITLFHFSFISGSLTASHKKVSTSNLRLNVDIDQLDFKNCRFVVIALFIFSFAGYFGFVNTVLKSFILDDLQGLAVVLNTAISEDSLEFGGILGRLYVLPGIAVPLNIFLYKHSNVNKKLILWITLFEIIFLVSPRRALLIQTLLVSGIVYLLINKVTKIKIIKSFILILFCLIFFSYTQAMLNKSVDIGLSGSLKTLYIYVAGNIPSFDLQIDYPYDRNGSYTLNVPNRIVHFFGLDDKKPDLSMEFVNTPIPFNTVPYFFYFYKDFGIVLGCLIVWVLSFSFAFFYHRRHFNNFFSIYLFSFVIISIVLSHRELTLITYDFMFFLIVAYVSNLLIFKRAK